MLGESGKPTPCGACLKTHMIAAYDGYLETDGGETFP